MCFEFAGVCVQIKLSDGWNWMVTNFLSCRGGVWKRSGTLLAVAKQFFSSEFFNESKFHACFPSYPLFVPFTPQCLSSKANCILPLQKKCICKQESVKVRLHSSNIFVFLLRNWLKSLVKFLPRFLKSKNNWGRLKEEMLMFYYDSVWVFTQH